jgi:hypothetical protein
MQFHFLDDQLKGAVLQNKMSLAAAATVKNVRTVEHRLRCHRTIKKTTHPRVSTCLTHILQEADGTINNIDDTSHMEAILFKHFQDLFNQATGTPFTKVPLRETFGYGGHIANTDNLLDGELSIQNSNIITEMS